MCCGLRSGREKEWASVGSRGRGTSRNGRRKTWWSSSSGCYRQAGTKWGLVVVEDTDGFIGDSKSKCDDVK